MPKGIEWTPAMDAKLLSMRVDGKAIWQDIADHFGVHKTTAIARGEKLGSEKLAHEAREAEAAEADPEDDWLDDDDAERDPLPAGHPASWGAISAEPFRVLA